MIKSHLSGSELSARLSSSVLFSLHPAVYQRSRVIRFLRQTQVNSLALQMGKLKPESGRELPETPQQIQSSNLDFLTPRKLRGVRRGSGSRYSRPRLHLDGAHLLQQAVCQVGTLGRELAPLALEVLHFVHDHLEGQCPERPPGRGFQPQPLWCGPRWGNEGRYGPSTSAPSQHRCVLALPPGGHGGERLQEPQLNQGLPLC